MAVVAIVAVLVAPLLLGPVGPPFGVYARPTPSISEEPLDLLPNQIAGFDLITAEASTWSEGEGANGIYEGGITIGIGRWSSSGAAASEIDTVILTSEDLDSFAFANAGEQHWYSFTLSEASHFAWRKGVWAFQVVAPDEALRNQVVQELPF